MTRKNESESQEMQPKSSASSLTDGRRVRGARTRSAAIAEAVQMASIEGLEGLSIAHLAACLGTAKSTVHATFGSKQSLQVAVIQETREILMELVVLPALAKKAGYQRLLALGEGWMSYLERETFKGGCVLSSASLEMDGRPGAAREAVAAVMKEWLALLTDNVQEAVAVGQINPRVKPEQLAFELNAIGMAANWQRQLFDDVEAFQTGRRGWNNLLNNHRL